MVESADALGPWPYVFGAAAGLASAAVGVGSILVGMRLIEAHPDQLRPIAYLTLAVPVLATAPLTAAVVALFDPGSALLAGFAAPFVALAGSFAIVSALSGPVFLVTTVSALAIALHPVIGVRGSLDLMVAGIYVAAALPLAGVLVSTTLTPALLSVRMLEEAE